MYSPVLQLNHTGRQWMVGKIENHQARPLTEEEVEKACDELNDLVMTHKPHPIEQSDQRYTCYVCGGNHLTGNHPKSLEAQLRDAERSKHQNPGDPTKPPTRPKGEGWDTQESLKSVVKFFNRNRDRRDVNWGDLSDGDRKEWERRHNEHEAIEKLAEEIYNEFPCYGVKPNWIPNGNSDKQEEARGLAKERLEHDKKSEYNQMNDYKPCPGCAQPVYQQDKDNQAHPYCSFACEHNHVTNDNKPIPQLTESPIQQEADKWMEDHRIWPEDNSDKEALNTIGRLIYSLPEDSAAHNFNKERLIAQVKRIMAGMEEPDCEAGYPSPGASSLPESQRPIIIKIKSKIIIQP